MNNMGGQTLHPENEDQLSIIVAEAAANKTPLEIAGRGSKRALGRPMETAAIVTTGHLQGVTLYEPSELVVSVLAGTPLQQVQHRLAGQNQELAFEPLDYGAALGLPEDQATIGGTIAANISGPRRIRVGAARDHVLGLRAVNGRGEIIKTGGRVLKNVTGYDLCKLLTGSWGTLAILTEITLKVLPKAQAVRTLFLVGIGDQLAVSALCTAMGTPFEVSAAAHIQAGMTSRLSDKELRNADQSITAIRLESFAATVDERTGKLKSELSAFGDIFEMDDDRSAAFWDDMRYLRFLRGSKNTLWRLSLAPKDGPKIVDAVKRITDCTAAYDWSGGLIWLELQTSTDANSADIRRLIAQFGGHATLVRSPPEVRAAVGAFQPLSAGEQRLSKGIKGAFDPSEILNPGRMYAGI